MNLLRPVRHLIARKPATQADWLEGLSITQHDIDNELLSRELAVPTDAEATGPRPAAVTWLSEGVGA